MRMPTKEEAKKFYEENKKQIWFAAAMTVFGLNGLLVAKAAKKSKPFIKNATNDFLTDAGVIDEQVFTNLAPQIEDAIIDGQSIVIESAFKNMKNIPDRLVKITVETDVQ